MTAIAGRVGSTVRPEVARRVAGTLFCALGLLAAVLVGRRITGTTWPLQDARLELVVAAAGAYLASFIFRAFGWRSLFPRPARPDGSRCLAACGAAAASGIILPFRLDYVVKVATLRRLSGVHLRLDVIVFSILSLGLVDAVAMLPLSIVALASSGVAFRAPLLVVLLFCVACLGILALGPRVARLPLVSRSPRLHAACGRIGGSTARSASTFVAAGLLMGCWLMRALGNTLLLWSLGVGFVPALAIVTLCLAAATSIVPITAGGALVSVGATSAVLLGLGVPAQSAVNFSLAASLLLTTTALIAAAGGVSSSVFFARKRRRPLRGRTSSIVGGEND